MDCFICPDRVWFVCMVYVCFILNHSVDTIIGDGIMTPLMMYCLEMSNISPLLLIFTFWQPVYVLLDEKEQSFPGKSKEVCSRFVGISENIGHAMTFKIVLDKSYEVVCGSLVRYTL